MSENMASGLKEAVEKDPRTFFEVGDAGLNTLHSLALGGSAACVRVLLGAGADPHVKAASGKTARELAAMMGWPRVVELLRDAEAVG
jgi:ankyrin repeat protein